jgi:light-regulated signal transduction histidine kinase (bacteriophytochrome)
MTGLVELATEYLDALRAHIDHPGEETLARAYEIGRATLARGGSLLELSSVHHQAIAEICSNETLARGRIEAAEAFFAESLSPFEMAHLGFREANSSLRRLNEELSNRNTELLKAKESAEAANRELEAFSYSVSHDLRAPLRAIDGFSQALQEDNAAQLDEQGRSYLNRVREATQRMSHLIDDLLRLARVAKGELTRQDVDLAAMAKEVVGRFKKLEQSREVELVTPEKLIVRGDARLLGVVMENLLANAWKFTSKRTAARIEVGVQGNGGGPIYFVRDNGAGFDPRFSERLFGAFQRLHTSDEFEGTGIGLATVQRIIRRHGGRIWAEGIVGEGATFYFTLGVQ